MSNFEQSIFKTKNIKKPRTYLLLKLNSLIKNHRLKFFGLWLLHTFNKRYLSVNFDPVNACNLKCKMCYFTDEQYVQKLKGVFDPKDLELWAHRILPRALKLQVGCGTEPTLYKHLDVVFALAKQYQVPHISLTTNANLLEKETLEQWIQNGLNEIIVSLHGVHRETYAFFMGKGDYEKFMNALQIITELKQTYPDLTLRINYTFNEDNFIELKDFFKVFNDYSIDIIQLRPIRKLGETAYQNFKLDQIVPIYMEVLNEFRAQSKKRNIALIATDHIDKLQNRNNNESVIFQYTYCYISPTAFWHPDFNWRTESFNAFSKRTGWGKQIFSPILKSKSQMKALQSEHLNYDIELN